MLKYTQHCYVDKLIHEELDYLCKELNKCINENYFKDSTVNTIIYILERIIFIEDYYKGIKKDKNEYYHYKNDGVTLLQANELTQMYQNEIHNNEAFMQEINRKTHDNIQDILKWIHNRLGIVNISDVWSGIKIDNNKFLWKSKCDSKHNEENCIRYLVNLIKHCYTYRLIIQNNMNAIAYIAEDFKDISVICRDCLKKYYNIA